MKLQIARRLRNLAGVAGFATLALGAQAAAATVYDFGISSKGSFQEIATLDVTGNGAATWNFDLKLLNSFDDIFGKGAFAGALAVNAVSSPQNILVGGIGGGGVGSVGSSNANGPSGFDFRFNLGSGQDRLKAGETVSWTASFSDTSCVGKGKKQVCSTLPFDVLTSGAAPFALHIQGIRGEDDSRWVYDRTAPVPEPGTYLLMLTGLGLMGAIVRRRQRR